MTQPMPEVAAVFERQGFAPLSWNTTWSSRATVNPMKQTLAPMGFTPSSTQMRPIVKNIGRFSSALRCVRSTRATAG